MNSLNTWVECLNCGNEYSVESILYLEERLHCPICNSEEYVNINSNEDFLNGDLFELNESLIKDGEWD